MIKNKAQSFLEYILILVAAITALLTIQIYIRGALQGRLKDLANQIGIQYAPKQTVGSSNYTYSTRTNSTSTTFSELDYGMDFDGDGSLSDDVFATETITVSPGERTSLNAAETVQGLP
jgi:hypothetical protein